MARERLLPGDPLRFIQDCIRRGQLLWTYHVNMRLAGRFILRESIFAAVDTFELVEAYPDDKYLPSYLFLGRAGAETFHVLLAVDVEGDNVRVVTAYRPDAAEWQDDLKTGDRGHEMYGVWRRARGNEDRSAFQGQRDDHRDPEEPAYPSVREVSRVPD